MKQIISIDENGTVQFIYDDGLAQLMDEGDARIVRASHVEPVQTHSGPQWQADMAPVGAGVLGPFPTRGAALEAEVAYLQNNVL